MVLPSILLFASPIGAKPVLHTPAPGSPERREIFGAMRKLGDRHDRIFIVRDLKVQGDWAWLTGDPQSPDGVSHYETESALLQKSAVGWSVVDQPCAEGDCDRAQEFARIRAAHPDAPAEIFPK